MPVFRQALDQIIGGDIGKSGTDTGAITSDAAALAQDKVGILRALKAGSYGHEHLYALDNGSRGAAQRVPVGGENRQAEPLRHQKFRKDS